MRIGRYEIVSELGRGGMASAFLARAYDGQYVVLKMPLVDDADTCERLRDEARTGLRLAHPHIVETLDIFEQEGKPVLVLSYVSGASMYELRTKGPLPPAVVLRIGRQICEALDAIHHATDERGRDLNILHRDVTAGNVMLGEDGDARLIDLGIAKSAESQASRTKSGCMRGTLRYIAPELFMGGDFSHASDLWSLGIVLLEAALGRTSFLGRNDAEIVLRIVDAKPLELMPGERLDAHVRRGLESLLHKDPKRRPTRARDAAAIFAMLEKDFPGSQEQASAALKRSLSAPRIPKSASQRRDPSRISTEVLVDRAQRTFGSHQFEIIEEIHYDAFDYESETVADADAMQSAETERYVPSTHTQPSPRARAKATTPGGPQPDALNPTGYYSVSNLVDDPHRYRSPKDAILAYARQLRDFEHDEERSGRMPRSELSGDVVG